MKHLRVFIVCVAIVTGGITVAYGEPEVIAEETTIQEMLDSLKEAYSTELVMGTPIEVNELKIIPLATVGIGFGPQKIQAEREIITGVGGILMPVGIIVISDQDVQIVQLSKGFVEQLASVLIPIALQLFPLQQEETEGKSIQTISTDLQQIKKNNLLFSTYWRIAFLFWIIWLILALAIEKFFPGKVTAISASFRYNCVQISFFGVIGFGIMFLLAAIFALSIIGLPLTFAVFLLTAVLTLLGTFGFALFVGHESATAFKYDYSDIRFMLIGGILFGLLGMIPLLGLLVWALVGIFGFGVILQMQWENLRKKHG